MLHLTNYVRSKAVLSVMQLEPVIIFDGSGVEAASK